MLYAIGVLGGLCATLFGSLSYRFMFLFGGCFGVLLWLARRSILESEVFLSVLNSSTIIKGNFYQLVGSFKNIKKLFRLFILNIPYQSMISLMFIIPMFMPLNYSAIQIPHIVLFCFFAGNLIACGFSMWFNNLVKSYKYSLYFSFGIYLIILVLFPLIHNKLFLPYCVLLGIIGGLIPVAWIQLLSKSYGINIRNTASNTLFAMGRGSSIIINLLLTNFLLNKSTFVFNVIIMVIVIAILAISSLFFSQETYHSETDFIEE